MERHNCQQHSVTKVSTERSPYHFVGSGLDNVYLIGVRYHVCKVCKKQAAELPAVRKLLRDIAVAVADSLQPLTGQEIRYLRKTLWKSSRDFAALVGVTPDQVSRWELDRNRPAPSADKLIRALVVCGVPQSPKRKQNKIVIRAS